jgi:hypothetical protein
LEERESFLKQIIVVITAAVVGVSAMERHLCCMPICRLKFLSSVVGVGKGLPGAWYK